MIIIYKALIGAGLFVGLHYLTKSSNYYLAQLALACPLLSMIAHYYIRVERDAGSLKQTVLFGVYAVLPFVAYLLTVYIFADKLKIQTVLALASGVWLILAAALTFLWRMYQV